jgi:glycine oxidase
MKVRVIGAGVAGLCTAVSLAEDGHRVELVEQGPGLGSHSCSWFAGGMLAPWCELESCEASIAIQGVRAIDWWAARVSGIQRNGSLVLAQPRDRVELDRFARRTRHFEWVDADRIAALEPALAGRYSRGLFFPDEAHVNPRQALQDLLDRFVRLGGEVFFNTDADDLSEATDRIIDCRGLAGRQRLRDLRGVRGEMLMLYSAEIHLQRPVRMLHPRIPLYVVPHGQGRYMVGATMIETEHQSNISVRSALELLNAAWSLLPAFGEATIVETGAHARPAFADNVPLVCERNGRLHVNGMYRHGFLMAPVLAAQVAETLKIEATCQ